MYARMYLLHHMLNILPTKEIEQKLENCLNQVEKVFGPRISGGSKEERRPQILLIANVVIQEELKERIEKFIKSALCDIRNENLVELDKMIDTKLKIHGGQPDEHGRDTDSSRVAEPEHIRALKESATIGSGTREQQSVKRTRRKNTQAQ